MRNVKCDGDFEKLLWPNYTLALSIGWLLFSVFSSQCPNVTVGYLTDRNRISIILFDILNADTWIFYDWKVWRWPQGWGRKRKSYPQNKVSDIDIVLDSWINGDVSPIFLQCQSKADLYLHRLKTNCNVLWSIENALHVCIPQIHKNQIGKPGKETNKTPKVSLSMFENVKSFSQICDLSVLVICQWKFQHSPSIPEGIGTNILHNIASRIHTREPTWKTIRLSCSVRANKVALKFNINAHAKGDLISKAFHNKSYAVIINSHWIFICQAELHNFICYLIKVCLKTSSFSVLLIAKEECCTIFIKLFSFCRKVIFPL